MAIIAMFSHPAIYISLVMHKLHVCIGRNIVIKVYTEWLINYASDYACMFSVGSQRLVTLHTTEQHCIETCLCIDDVCSQLYPLVKMN